jgi:hypothetical protein
MGGVVSVLAGDDDYWTIRIPKPRRLVRWLRYSIIGGMRRFAMSNITVDIPLLFIISFFVGVLSFILFTLVLRIPDVVSLIFAVILVIIYVASTASYFRH